MKKLTVAISAVAALQTIMRLSLSHLSYAKKNRTNIKRRYIAY